jgi:Polyketide cyclase / dehydrase and lipid transport
MMACAKSRMATGRAMLDFLTHRHVAQSVDEMFSLVADVERYPEFLPFCRPTGRCDDWMDVGFFSRQHSPISCKRSNAGQPPSMEGPGICRALRAFSQACHRRARLVLMLPHRLVARID